MRSAPRHDCWPRLAPGVRWRRMREPANRPLGHAGGCDTRGSRLRTRKAPPGIATRLRDECFGDEVPGHPADTALGTTGKVRTSHEHETSPPRTALPVGAMVSLRVHRWRLSQDRRAPHTLVSNSWPGDTCVRVSCTHDSWLARPLPGRGAPVALRTQPYHGVERGSSGMAARAGDGGGMPSPDVREVCG